MSVALGVLVLAGLAGVPGLLLWTGRDFRGYSNLELGAYRGAVVGYLASMVLVTLVLLWPPHVWPPAGTGERLLLAGGLLAGPALGAAWGAVRARRRSG